MTPVSDTLMMSPAEAIQFLAQEIARMSDRLTKLELGIEALCQSGAPSQKEALRHLQEIDILVQSSETLATYAQSLSNKLEANTSIDAADLLRAVPLRDIAARLAGEEAESSCTDFHLL